jgi:beta-glucanase (GH16 family)
MFVSNLARIARIALSLLTITACASTATNPAANLNMKLVWSDEFDGTGLADSSRWAYEKGVLRNKEAQYYVANRLENAQMRDGRMVITARKESWEGSQYTSSSLTTRGKFEFRYGRVEVRAKVPRGRGAWPAIWFLGANIGSVGWPKCGEIDLLENVGYNPDRVFFNVHTKKYNHTKKTNKGANIAVNNFPDEFHTYTLDWTPDKLIWSFDGKSVFEFVNEGNDEDAWPFDKPIYLILNLAVGGTWGGQKGIDDAAFPMEYLIDYVRIYQ